MKRAYSRGEKSLFLAPLLIAVVGGVTWMRREAGPVTLGVPLGHNLESISFSPDGKRLAVINSEAGSGFSSGCIYDVESRAEICRLELPPVEESPNPAAKIRRPLFRQPSWSPDGKRLVAAYDDGALGFNVVGRSGSGRGKSNGRGIRYYLNTVWKMAIWDTDSGQISGRYLYAPPTESTSCQSVHFSKDGQTLIGLGQPPSEFDARSGARLRVFKNELKNVSRVARSETTGLLAWKDLGAKRFQVFDPNTKQVLWEPRVEMGLNFSWRGEILAVTEQRSAGAEGDTNGHILLWDAKTRKTLGSPPVRAGWMVRDLQLHPDGRRLVYFTSSMDVASKTKGEIVFYDYRQNRELGRVPSDSLLLNFGWSPDGRCLCAIAPATADKELTLKVFRSDGQLLLESPMAPINPAWSPDSHRLAALLPSGESQNQLAIVPVGE